MKRVDVAIAIVQSQHRLLICQRRANDTFANQWEFPGGKCEPGETPQQCLHRELREELGIEVRPLLAFEPIEHEYSALHVRLHPFLCQHESGEVRPLQCQQAVWIDPPRLRDYSFPEANAPLIERIIDHFSRLPADAR